MKIIFVLPIAGMSGGIKVVSIYALGLKMKGHEVVLISPPPVRMSFLRRIKSFLQGRGWPRNSFRPKSQLDNSGLDHRVLECWRPVVDTDVPDADVVVATWWETAEWVNRLSGSKGAKVYFVQGHETFSNLPIDRVKATYCLPMQKIVVSEWLRRIMEHLYKDRCTKLVPNSVDRSQFHAPVRSKQDRPTVGFLFSNASVKGIDVALKVVRSVRVKYPNLRVISFGSSPVSTAENWDTGIEFVESPAPMQLRDLYAQCDVWLSASRSEGFNLTAMEAMACRTPVVSTRTGWPEDAIRDYVNGVLAEVDDIEALTAGVLWALSLSEANWCTVSDSAYMTASVGSWEESIDLFELALLECVGKYEVRT